MLLDKLCCGFEIFSIVIPTNQMIQCAKAEVIISFSNQSKYQAIHKLTFWGKSRQIGCKSSFTRSKVELFRGEATRLFFQSEKSHVHRFSYFFATNLSPTRPTTHLQTCFSPIYYSETHLEGKKPMFLDALVESFFHWQCTWSHKTIFQKCLKICIQ